MGDITDEELVTEAMSEVDMVVHFAAESHVDRSIMAAGQFVMTNVVGTYTLLEVAKKVQVKRFHHISTDEVFGSVPKGKSNEGSLYNPSSPYSATKASSDHMVYAYFHTYKLPITITNCSNNYGPYQFPEKFIPLAITNILEGKDVPIYGDGLHVRDWLHVDDHVRAVERVLTRDVVGETFCVGGMTEDITNLDVVKKILKYMGKEESLVRHVDDRPGHDRRYAVEWGKIQKSLGWEPKQDFDTHLKKTIDWYKENEAWWKNVKSGEYQKYYKKQYGEKPNEKKAKKDEKAEPADTYVVPQEAQKKDEKSK